MEDVVRPKTLEERLCAIEKRAWRVPKVGEVGELA